jgi:iron complex outermembrane receptor protein
MFCGRPCLPGLGLLALSIPAAHAADAVDIGTVGARGQPVSPGTDDSSDEARRLPKGETATEVAPTQAPLRATEPVSVIHREFIEQTVPITGDFTNVARIAPSASGISVNGPGLAESTITLRGFKDGEYNVTFDGIPFGDTSSNTHRSTAYFPAPVIGSMAVERGPGNASNLGQATFGGSINMFSRVLPSQGQYSAEGALGSWGTQALGLEYLSGVLQDHGDANVMLNYLHQSSNGYLTNSAIQSDNLFLKFQRPVGDSSLLTLMSAYNRQNCQPDDNGATLAQVALFGKNFALSADPTKPTFVGFNQTTKSADFEYLRLQTGWGSNWSTDNKLYTYSFTNNTLSGTDYTGATPNGTKAGPKGNVDVPGFTKLGSYRVVGNILQANKNVDTGQLRTGLWLETADTTRNVYDVDLTRGGIPDPTEKTFPFSIKYDQHSSYFQYQPFAEFEWKASPDLSITPGYKYVNIRRSIDALVNQTTRLSTDNARTYTAHLPFLTANYRIDSEWSTYAQLARGFRAPDLSAQYVVNPNLGQPVPQTSTNKQVGIVHQSGGWTFDADVYHIDFNNKIASIGTGNSQVFYNQGGVTYKGIEAQATYVIGGGLSVFANGSLNSARSTTTGLTIAGAPSSTAALGALYATGPWSVSLIAKQTGSQYAAEGEPAAYRIGAWTTTDLNVVYTVDNVGGWARRLRIQLAIYNLGNNQSVLSITPNAKGAAFDQYLFVPGRSAMLSMRVEI